MESELMLVDEWNKRMIRQGVSENIQRPSIAYLLFAIGATILLVLPLIASRHLPLMDALGHEARLLVLRKYFLGMSSPFYEVTTFLLPNMASDTLGLFPSIRVKAFCCGSRLGGRARRSGF